MDRSKTTCVSTLNQPSTHHHPVHTHTTCIQPLSLISTRILHPPSPSTYPHYMVHIQPLSLFRLLSSTHHHPVHTHTTCTQPLSLISTRILHPPSPSTYPHYMHTTSVSHINPYPPPIINTYPHYMVHIQPLSLFRLLSSTHHHPVHTHTTCIQPLSLSYQPVSSTHHQYIPTLHGTHTTSVPLSHQYTYPHYMDPALQDTLMGTHYSPIPTYTLPVGPIAGPTPTAHVDGHPYARTRFKSGLDSLLINLISPVPIHLWISDRIYLD